MGGGGGGGGRGGREGAEEGDTCIEKTDSTNIEGEGWRCGGREGRTDRGERDAKDDISLS